MTISPKSIELLSDRRELIKIESFLRSAVKDIQLTEDEFGKIFIAATEAVTNAMIHGNKLNCSKKVYLEVEAGEKTVRVRIRDEGEGFNPNNLPSPISAENLLKENGRGIFIIKNMMDEVKFIQKEKGMTVEMKLNL